MATQDKLDFFDHLIETIGSESNFLFLWQKVVDTCRGQKSYQEMAVRFIKKAIKDSEIESMNKFLSLLLLRQMVGHLDIMHLVERVMLNRMKVLALFRNKDNVQERGRMLFGPDRDQDYSQSFYELNLEMI